MSISSKIIVPVLSFSPNMHLSESIIREISPPDAIFVSGAKGGLFNTLVVGASYTQEDYSIENAQLLRAPGGATPNPAQPPISLSNPNTLWTGPVNYIRTGNSYGDTRNLAVYAFDTLEISPMFELNAGIRYENVRTIFRADTVTTPDAGAIYTRGADQISDETISRFLDTSDLPDPDLIVRTSGELRLSNFLLWEAAYAELVFQDILWPDYGPDALKQAVDEFRARDRRFGGRQTPMQAVG